MRDSHRLKEKYELSLDSRQIVTLTVVSLVVLGGVFVLGVVVGKKLAHETQRLDQPADILSAADQKTEALAQADKAPSLTFQEELTARAPEPAKTVVALKPMELRPEPSKPPEAAKPAEPARVEAAEPRPSEPKPDEVKIAEAPRAEEPTRLPETPKAEPVATRTNDAGALKEAFGKAQKPPEAPPEGGWTLQLSAYQDKGEAERFAAGLRDKGYAPFIIEANVPGKGVWFRVRMGRFGSKEAATTYLSDFKRETSIAGIVTNN
ncbi:MAG: SPOR domain-containing protein [Myxococcaceae bacterium]|nr:SPOR domain-containing protein [Myxococcaceae bacterium]